MGLTAKSTSSDIRTQKRKPWYFLPALSGFSSLVFCIGVYLCCLPSSALGEEKLYTTFSTPRFTLHIESANPESAEKYRSTKSLASEAVRILNQNFDEISRIFDVKPKNKVVLRFLSPVEFTKRTGAPSWTSAMFFDGDITVPITPSRPYNFSQLKRALRHEQVHAIIAEMAGEKGCPAWMDEGLAQLIEGRPNPVLGPALRKWIARDFPMPLVWLENGFTSLQDSIVPAAYAQSLFAVRTLVNTHGFKKIRNYLAQLKQNKTPETAFKLAFGTSQQEFETRLTFQIVRWAKSSNPNP